MLGMKDLEVDPGTDVAALALSSVSLLSFVGQFAAQSFTVVKIAGLSQNLENCEKRTLVKISCSLQLGLRCCRDGCFSKVKIPGWARFLNVPLRDRRCQTREWFCQVLFINLF